MRNDVSSLNYQMLEESGLTTVLQDKLAVLCKLESTEAAPQLMIDQTDLDRLNRAAHHRVAAQLQLETEFANVLKLLEPFTPIFLKGFAMAYKYYPEPYHRPMVDVDILISSDHAKDIRDVLQQAGYTLLQTNFGEIVLSQFSCIKDIGGSQKLHLDLHTRLFNRPTMIDLLTSEEIFQNKQTISINGQSAWIPCPAHCLLHAALHLMAHHHNSRRLIWLYDIKLILEKFNESDYSALYQYTHNKLIAKIVEVAVQSALERFPIPGNDLVKNLSQQSLQQQNKNHPSTAYLMTNQSKDSIFLDWKHMKGTQLRLSWLKEHLFPGSDYIKSKYGIKSKLLIVFFYVWRIIAGSVRLLKK